MLSKNNLHELRQKIGERKDRFALRKLSIGVASLLLGSFFLGINVYASDTMHSTSAGEQTNQPSQRWTNSEAKDKNQLDNDNVEVNQTTPTPNISNQVQPSTPASSYNKDSSGSFKIQKSLRITADTNPDEIPAGIEINPTSLKKEVHLTVKYKNSDNTHFKAKGEIPTNSKQTLVFYGTAYADYVVPKLQTASFTVNYIDSTTGNLLSQDTVSGYIGAQINYDVSEKIMLYENMGYKLEKNGYRAEKHFSAKDNGKTYDVYFVHGTTSVTPTNPGGGLSFPSNPVNPTMSLFSINDSKNDNSIKPVGHWVLRTDDQNNPQISWNPSTKSFNKVISPVEDGYYIESIKSDDQNNYGDENNNIRAIDNISKDSKDITLTVLYAPKIKISIVYVDDSKNYPQDLSSYNKEFSKAKPGTSLNGYVTTNAISDLEKKGFTLVSDDFKNAGLNDKMPAETKTYYVHLIHAKTTVTPINPGIPGQPVNPANPLGPKYPNGTDKDDLILTGSQTIHYVGAGALTPADNYQSSNFERTITFDNVTGNITNTEWQPVSYTFKDVASPSVPGYHPLLKVVKGSTITPTDLRKFVTVVYVKDGTYIENSRIVNASQIVHYVSEEGEQLHTPKLQNFEFIYTGDTIDNYTNQLISHGKWLTTSHTFTVEDVPSIQNYVAISGYNAHNGKLTTAGFITSPFDSNNRRNRIFTVVYRKVKRLLPTPQTTPNSTPDPTLNLPTPDNPGTPTDVDTPVPDTPVPNVPGDTPLTPADPSGKTVTDTVKPQQKTEQELPQTGNDHSTNESVLGLLTLALTGLFISGKKQRKE